MSFADTARELVVQAFPGEGLVAALLLLDITLSEDDDSFDMRNLPWPEWVREHCELHGLKVGNVIVSSHTRVVSSGSGSPIAETSSEHSYYQPLEGAGVPVSFESLSAGSGCALPFQRHLEAEELQGELESWPIATDPGLLRGWRWEAVGSGDKVFALAAGGWREPGNFSSAGMGVRCEITLTETTNFQVPLSIEAEFRSLTWEDCVASLTVHARVAGGDKGGAEGVGEWLTKISRKGMIEESELQETGILALRSLRRLLPVHKQRFDWNVHRVAGTLPNQNT